MKIELPLLRISGRKKSVVSVSSKREDGELTVTVEIDYWRVQQ
jgi:hypothetical protein